MKKVLWGSYIFSFAIANMDFENDEFPWDDLSQAEEIRCEDVRGHCGCLNCEKNAKNTLMTKYRHPVSGEYLWGNTKKYLAAIAAYSARLINQCASSNTYCGCDMCNIIKGKVEQQGVDELTVFDWKPMNLDTGIFEWDYSAVEKRLGKLYA
jgi:hypothetical protein